FLSSFQNWDLQTIWDGKEASNRQRAISVLKKAMKGDNFSSGTSSRKFLVPLVILLYLPSHVHFSFMLNFFSGISNHRLGVTHIPLLWSCPPAAGQHNNARMNLAFALTAARYGAAIANYTEVVHLLERADPQTGKERVFGARSRDVITGQEFDVRAKCVINATGPFVDALRKMDDQKNPDICQPSAGVHIVILGYYRRTQTHTPQLLELLDPVTLSSH
uniref:glycerol-3-phosphate dehydrogenase n=1 Tax=Echeneis naucrates TaxID=173247 RepID=A0A665W0D0_ECHNA